MKRKNLIKSVVIMLTIILLIDFYWLTVGSWYSYIGLVGYASIGFYIAGYYNYKERLEK